MAKKGGSLWWPAWLTDLTPAIQQEGEGEIFLSEQKHGKKHKKIKSEDMSDDVRRFRRGPRRRRRASADNVASAQSQSQEEEAEEEEEELLMSERRRRRIRLPSWHHDRTRSCVDILVHLRKCIRASFFSNLFPPRAGEHRRGRRRSHQSSVDVSL